MGSSRQPPAADAARRGPGALVRAARAAQGLSLAELGRRVGYSASQISRYERGLTPLTDITVLRRFADALAIPPQQFGLKPATGPARHALFAEHRTPGPHRNTVGQERQWEDGEDPVRRREMLTGTAALAGAAALGGIRAARPGHAISVHDVLYGRTSAAPVTLPELRASIVAARSDFQTARYEQVTTALPRLLAAAQATTDAVDSSQHADTSTLLADAYLLAADFAVKINDDPLAWMTADRALQAAPAGNDPLTLADARRAVATSMRRAGHPARACDLLVRACHDLGPADGDPDTLAMYGTMLNVAAYTAATAGDRGAARDYATEAAAAAGRLGRAAAAACPHSARQGSPSTRSASPRYSATTAPPSTTRGNCVPPTSPPPNGRAATGSTWHAPTTSGEKPAPATPRCSRPNAQPPPKSATGHRSTA